MNKKDEFYKNFAPFPSYKRGCQLGLYYKKVCEEVKSHGLDYAISFAKTLGGMRQPRTYAKSLIVLLSKTGELPATKVENSILHFLELSWITKGKAHKQVACISYVPWRGAQK